MYYFEIEIYFFLATNLFHGDAIKVKIDFSLSGVVGSSSPYRITHLYFVIKRQQ